MALIVDAGALFAQANADDPDHEAISQRLTAEAGPPITSVLAAAEADYLILDRLGIDTELQFLTDLVEATFTVECLSRTDLAVARDLVEQYRDLRVGLADASLVVLARRHHTRRILTFDHRAFRTMAPLQGGRFSLLPADE